MTKPHRSTPEHWATVERYAQQVSSTDDCLLELRSRVEALEAGTSCPHVVTSGEGTSYCRLAEQAVAEDSSAPPASSLVERVDRAAIREVAAWLRAGRMLHAAELLEQEVGR
jgi:hypothetical protein